jgi:maleate isomerase
MRAGGAMDRTIPLAPVVAFVQPPHIDDAVALLAAARLGAIGIGFTSSSYVLGADAEKDVVVRLGGRSRGIPVVATGAAAADGLHRLAATRIALVSPPWFDSELDELGAQYFESQGFDVAFHAPAPLPSEQWRIEPAALFEWVRANTPRSADAVFIGGNGFRAVGVIAALEDALGLPVLTANQALLWGMLRAADSAVAPDGYGRLFAIR